jgi:DNA-nicking Smr family endonuclease
MVLVITGKGPAGQDSEIRPFGAPERGVLKRLVPKWLAETELGALVTGYSTAKARHGGAGALYVRLRRVRRVKE